MGVYDRPAPRYGQTCLLELADDSIDQRWCSAIIGDVDLKWLGRDHMLRSQDFEMTVWNWSHDQFTVCVTDWVNTDRLGASKNLFRI